MGDYEITGLADAVKTSVSEKLTWLLLGVLNLCRLKIPKRKPSCAERTTFHSPDINMKATMGSIMPQIFLYTRM